MALVTTLNHKRNKTRMSRSRGSNEDVQALLQMVSTVDLITSQEKPSTESNSDYDAEIAAIEYATYEQRLQTYQEAITFEDGSSLPVSRRCTNRDRTQDTEFVMEIVECNTESESPNPSDDVIPSNVTDPMMSHYDSRHARS